MQKTIDKFIKISGPVHRICKAAAALRGLELKEWAEETLETSARAEISAHALLNDDELTIRDAIPADKEPACVRKQ